MKKYIFYLLFIVLQSNLSFSQIALDNVYSASYNIPQEKIFVHQNSSLLISGENLYYKIYCLNANTNNLSTISKIGYVALIKNDNTVVFKHKIKLDTGIGQGDFFINKSIPSGSYKLISYTENMKNFENTFFQSDLCIINPFQPNQQTKPSDNLVHKNSNLSVKNENNLTAISTTNSLNNTFVDFNTNAITFKNREKVTLTLESLKGNLSYGNYSISVRKIDTLQKPKLETSQSFKFLYPETSIAKTKINLPELRGELLTGKVTTKATNLPASNLKVALSIPGKNPIFKIATTNNSGAFFFSILEEYENNNAIIQVIGEDRNNFEIVINEQSTDKFKNLNFYDFKITPALKDYILEKSVFNQIENVYAGIKPNTYKKIDSIKTFYNSKLNVYFLDDYTRFLTIKETFIEIIKEVYSKQKKGNTAFYVRLHNQLFDSDNQALVLVDGILIQNHNDLLNLNIKNTQKISILNDAYIFDGTIFDGAIFIETFTGDYSTNSSESYIQKLQLLKPLTNKLYYSQQYNNSDKFSRIPDYRNQLTWIPNFILHKNSDELSFFTSDIDGEFEICFEGFTNNGMPVSLRKKIQVH